MIKINNKKYSNYSIEVYWGNIEVTVLGKKVKNNSPFIQFNIEDNIFIGIETIIPKEILKSLNIDEEISINQYLTDIIYKDQKGWISVITGKYNCWVTRKSNSNFEIKADINQEINISINSIFKIEQN